MKIYRKISFKWTALLLLCVAVTFQSCERDVSDDAVEATFNPDGRVFIDGFSTGLEYLPFSGSFQEAFSVETTEVFEGEAAMRFDIPNVGDNRGPFAGAIFKDEFGGRDLRSFDALTFYAKASMAATINEIGFGTDFEQNEFVVTRQNLQLGTNWRKYIIPIPDPSRLEQVSGLLFYSEGADATGGNAVGYTFYLDEVEFVNTGTVAQPRPFIQGGQESFRETFIGSAFNIGDIGVVYNTVEEGDVRVNAAPAYFNFSSSDTNVAVVDSNGRVEVVGSSALDVNGDPIPVTITATLGTDDDGNPIEAEGVITVVSLGDFNPAPMPDQAPENVISIFSDAYDNVPVDYYNGFFAPFQTTQGGAPPLSINGDQVINYTDLNFVAIGTFLNVPTVNASSMTHIHVDINVQEMLGASDFINFQLNRNVGSSNETSAGRRITASELATNEWRGFDIPLSELSALGGLDNIGLYFFITDATITNILVDNVYFYREVVDPTPTVDDSAATTLMLPIGFESTTLNYNIGVFAGADSMIVPNPDASGINTSSRVLQSIKTNGAEFFAGTTIDLPAPIDLSSTQKLNFKAWSPKPNLPIRVALETATGSDQVFVDAVLAEDNEWTELQFDFGSVYNPSIQYQRIVLFFEFDAVVQQRGDGSTYFADDLKLVP